MSFFSSVSSEIMTILTFNIRKMDMILQKPASRSRIDTATILKLAFLKLYQTERENKNKAKDACQQNE